MLTFATNFYSLETRFNDGKSKSLFEVYCEDKSFGINDDDDLFNEESPDSPEEKIDSSPTEGM